MRRCCRTHPAPRRCGAVRSTDANPVESREPGCRFARACALAANQRRAGRIDDGVGAMVTARASRPRSTISHGMCGSGISARPVSDPADTAPGRPPDGQRPDEMVAPSGVVPCIVPTSRWVPRIRRQVRLDVTLGSMVPRPCGGARIAGQRMVQAIHAPFGQGQRRHSPNIQRVVQQFGQTQRGVVAAHAPPGAGPRSRSNLPQG